MDGEQRAACDAEILPARLAAKARRAVRAAAIVGIQAAAMRANRGAVGLRPADFAEGRFGFLRPSCRKT